MIRKICTDFVNYICEDNYNNDDKEVMEYILRVFILEFLKIIGNLILFYILGYFIEAIIILAVTSLIKPFIGGFHANTQVKCFLSTIAINMCIILINKGASLNFYSLIILLSISFIAIYNQAPIINENMPLTKPELFKSNRKRGLTSLSIISLISICLYFYNTLYSCLIVWTIIFLAVLMFNSSSWKQNL